MMARYINADDLPVTTVAIRPYAISEEPYNAEVVFARFVRNAPTADVQAFFTEDEIALINEYKDLVEAVDFKTAILNAVSVALDKTYWLNVFSNSAWIPVSERLPELDMTKPDECICLIWCDDGVGYDIGYYTNESIFSPNAIGEPHWIRPRFGNVVAWMPLPETFKPYGDEVIE